MGPVRNLFGGSQGALARSLAAAAMMLGGAVTALPAHAQTVVDVRTIILGELSIVKSKDLNFGGIAGTAAGTVDMTPTAAATCTASAGLVHVNQCQPGEFIGKGQTGRVVRIKKPTGDLITLIGPGANMTITGLVLDGNPELTLVKQTPGYSQFRISSANGIFTFRLAGRLNVGANQAPGVYTGTFNVVINYN